MSLVTVTFVCIIILYMLYTPTTDMRLSKNYTTLFSIVSQEEALGHKVYFAVIHSTLSACLLLQLVDYKLVLVII